MSLYRYQYLTHFASSHGTGPGSESGPGQLCVCVCEGRRVCSVEQMHLSWCLRVLQCPSMSLNGLLLKGRGPWLATMSASVWTRGLRNVNPLSLSFALSLSPALTLPRSLFRALSFTRSHSTSLTLPLSLAFARSLSFTNSLSLYLSVPLSLSKCLSVWWG